MRYFLKKNSKAAQCRSPESVNPLLKRLNLLCFFAACLFSLSVCGYANDSVEPASDRPTSASYTQQIVSQFQLVEKGRQLVKQGQYEEGLREFYEALDPIYIKYDQDRMTPTAYIVRTLILLGDYEKALKEWQWFVDGNKRNDEAKVKAKQILALKKFRATGDASIVQKYLKFYMKKKSKSLPPSFEWGAGPSEVATVLRLYNAIGDHDAGIKLINDILAFFRTGKAGDPKPGKSDAAYINVREAFEQDKRDGFKGCAHSPPGQVCMGKATKALIQSDYFPW